MSHDGKISPNRCRLLDDKGWHNDLRFHVVVLLDIKIPRVRSLEVCVLETDFPSPDVETRKSSTAGIGLRCQRRRGFIQILILVDYGTYKNQ